MVKTKIHYNIITCTYYQKYQCLWFFNCKEVRFWYKKKIAKCSQSGYAIYECSTKIGYLENVL